MSALLKKIIFVCASPFVFVSCATLSQSSGSSKVMTVFMEDGTLKHYIRPSVMTAAAPQEKSSVMIDFTYRMKNRDYVSPAYTNFTLYSKKDVFVEQARFVFSSGTAAELTEIKTLDKNAKQGFVRAATLLSQEAVESVLSALHDDRALLEITLDDGTTQTFRPSKDLIDKIAESFGK